MNRTVQYLTLWDWLLLRSLIQWPFIRVIMFVLSLSPYSLLSGIPRYGRITVYNSTHCGTPGLCRRVWLWIKLLQIPLQI